MKLNLKKTIHYLNQEVLVEQLLVNQEIFLIGSKEINLNIKMQLVVLKMKEGKVVVEIWPLEIMVVLVMVDQL